MDNESTRLINDPAYYKQAPTSKNYSISSASTKKSAKKGPSSATAAAAAGGFVAGTAVGIGGTAFASTGHTPSAEADLNPTEATPDLANPEDANETSTTNSTNTEAEAATGAETAAETPSPEQVILANDEGVRYAHVQADNFNDAFAQARAQVGPGGVFEYNGRLYGTYYADEWNEMSSQERADYQNRVNEVAPSHHTTSSHYADSHHTTSPHYADSHHTSNSNYADSHHSKTSDHSALATEPNHTSGHTASTPHPSYADNGVITAEPADTEIRVLGVESVQAENGQIMNLAVVEAGGDRAMMIDVDNNGSIDVLLHDDNGDNRIQESEVYDVSSAQIDIRDLAQLHMMQQGDVYQASEDITPDPMTDFDSYAEV